MKRDPIEVFSEWADSDKDYGMEKNHENSVQNMLDFAIEDKLPFSFIDAGCGNGWVVRKVSKISNCTQAVGIDGSEKMILKARKIDPKLNYYCADIMSWAPKKKVDLVHSMEVFYYLEDPKKVIDNIYKNWLNQDGRLIIGIDFYKENKTSHDWSESCGIKNMKLISEYEWLNFFKNSGFRAIKTWKYGSKKDWEGTLIITGEK